MLEVEILATPLEAVEHQSEEGAMVLEVDFLVPPLDVVATWREVGYLMLIVILARHHWYSDGFQASFGMGRSFFFAAFLALGAGGGQLCFLGVYYKFFWFTSACMRVASNHRGT